MKLWVGILYVIAFLALTDSTLGDDEATSPRVCTVKMAEHRHMFGRLAEMALDCVATDGTGIEELKETKSLDERKTFFKNICDKRQRIRECLRVVEEESEVCQEQTLHATFKIFRELLETTLGSGCVQDGEVLASMLTIYDNSSSDPFTSDPFHSCVASGIEAIVMSGNVYLQIETLIFLLYRDAINIKECFGTVTHEEDINVARQIKSMLNEIVERMKCIHPQDGTPVLCTTMDVTLPDTPRICPIKSYDEERSSVFDLLTERFASCLQADNYIDRGQITDIETVGESLSLMRHYCVRKKMIGRCLSDVVAFSSTCLDETHHNVVRILEDSLQHVLEYGCIADGEYLGYVLYKVMSEMKKTPNQKIVKECVAVAGQTHLDTGSPSRLDADRVLIYHRQLKVFKGCFVNKLRGDNRAVFNADTLLTLVQKSMKCIEPEHGTMVLCETMDPTSSTAGFKVCPFVGEDENEPPRHEMFVDLGINCIKTSTKDSRLDVLPTLEAFQTFFISFCSDRLAVNYCVDELSSNSAVCQNQTNHQMFTIFTDLLHTVLETGCEHDGEALATIMHVLTSDAERGVESDQVKVCLDTAGEQMKTTRLSGVSTSAKSMTLYRTLESLKECILNANYEVGFKNVFAKFLNDVLRSFKCIHPDDGTLVLCELIVNN